MTSSPPGGPTARYLIDTSAWITVLARRASLTPLQARVTALMQARVAATSPLVRMELLRGARDTHAFERIERVLAPLHLFPLEDSLCDAAARIGFDLRRLGTTVAAVDLLIAATALRADAVVLHCDSDYDLIARHTSLRVESHV